MKNKICCLLISCLVIPNIALCDEVQQIDSEINQKNQNHYNKVPSYIQFDPNDSYSFIVYKRGDIVQYKGKIYKAKENTNNNSIPPKDARWELLAESPVPKATTK
jgi:hypothetical protein